MPVLDRIGKEKILNPYLTIWQWGGSEYEGTGNDQVKNPEINRWRCRMYLEQANFRLVGDTIFWREKNFTAE
ncbi:MAG: hypothetical protein LBQ30_08345 [Treponema sp.]|jgi:hypothetical protein|nr:hypothetical protein [Treponema sp.]